LDLGEKPTKSADINFSAEMFVYGENEDGSRAEILDTTVSLSYKVNGSGKKTGAELVGSIEIGAADATPSFEAKLSLKAAFDRENNKASFTAELNSDELMHRRYDVECDLVDTGRELSLTLNEITRTDNERAVKEIELPCKLKISAFKNAGYIRLPMYENIFEMSGRSFDKLYVKMTEFVEGLEDSYTGTPTVENDGEVTEGATDTNPDLPLYGGSFSDPLVVTGPEFPSESDIELNGSYINVSSPNREPTQGTYYNFLYAGNFVNSQGKSGQYRVKLEDNRIYFKVNEYPEAYYILEYFEYIDERTVKIGSLYYKKTNK
jgi:hypothetical protein